MQKTITIRTTRKGTLPETATALNGWSIAAGLAFSSSTQGPRIASFNTVEYQTPGKRRQGVDLFSVNRPDVSGALFQSVMPYQEEAWIQKIA